MRSSLILVALVAICLTGGARAQTAVQPEPYAAPLSPMSQPRFELGARFWASEGKTSSSINSSRSSPDLGNPTSILTYDNMEGYSGEFFWNVRNERNTFIKGLVGGGGLTGGSLDDEDFLAGQIKDSDTFSKLDGDALLYGTIDIGQRFVLVQQRAYIAVSPFIGFNFRQEHPLAYGLRCNRDDVDNIDCPQGEVVVPFSTKVIGDEENWASLRLGGELRMSFSDRLTLIGDAAILPVAYLWNEDSHYLRDDLGPVPNIEDTGTGWGYQLEAEARYDVTSNWSAGAGVRYWYATTDGTSDFVHIHEKVELTDFTSERFGVFGDVTYRFASF